MTPAIRTALGAALESLRSAAFAIEVLISDGIAPHEAPQPRPAAPPAPRRRGGRAPLDLPPKTCAICGSTFTRRMSADGRSFAEGTADYRKRQTCGRDACAHAIAMRTRHERNDRVEVPERACSVCGKPIPRRDRSPTQYAALKSCSRSCANQARSITKRGRPARTQTPTSAPAPKAAPQQLAKKPAKPNWTHEELDILRAIYPSGGATAAATALEEAGHTPRSPNTVAVKAKRMGISKLADAERDQHERDRILALLNDYGGLPLNQDDFFEELAIARERLRGHLKHLADAGQVATRSDPAFATRTLYFAPEATA